MWQQRLHTLARCRRREENFKLNLVDASGPGCRQAKLVVSSFRVLVLVNLPSLADATHDERQLDTGTADLLFFPTGGGKTKACLGLTAFTLAIRRLQGEVNGRWGEGGVGVLMRSPSGS